MINTNIMKDEFVDNINALGRTEDGFIELSKRATLKELQTNVIAHEMTHNKITQDLGGKQVWDLIDDDPLTRELLKPFDEYLTESTAKNLLGNNHVMTDLKTYSNAKYFIKDGYLKEEYKE
jgi:hypothetical protein